MTVPVPTVAGPASAPLALTVWPVAVSPLVAYVVSGPPRPARVVAAFDTAVFLAVPGLDDVILPLLTADALLLPTGLRLSQTSVEVDFDLSPGDTVLVGEGSVRWRHVIARVVRSWRPARVALQPGGGSRPSSAEVRRLLAGSVGDGRAVLAGLAAALVREVRRGAGATPYLLGLVGRGTGLTPSGDDALVAALLVLSALGQPLPKTFEPAYARTTTLSASLLRAASEGYAIPAVVRLADAAIAGDVDVCRAVLPEVLAVGHTSGADHLAGLVGALRALGSPDAQDQGDLDLAHPDLRGLDPAHRDFGDLGDLVPVLPDLPHVGLAHPGLAHPGLARHDVTPLSPIPHPDAARGS